MEVVPHYLVVERATLVSLQLNELSLSTRAIAFLQFNLDLWTYFRTGAAFPEMSHELEGHFTISHNGRFPDARSRRIYRPELIDARANELVTQ
jgi:hypothetical protein